MKQKKTSDIVDRLLKNNSHDDKIKIRGKKKTNGGYSIYLNRSLNLEFSLGLGYLSSINKNYSVYEDLLLRKNTSKFTYYGPTKAKVSLVWFINNKYYR